MIVTSTEAEALHLEQNLVKRHRPPFNVRLRDDKSFPYIAVTVADEYPRVMFTRERHRRGTVYFGPYANAKKVRETLDVLNRVFQFRPCEGPKPGRHSGIPCLDFHIERCTAPCIGAISKEEYREQIDGVIEFLSGDTRSIVRSLEQRMREAAAEERFEDATRYRNRLFAIESLAERQGADRRDVGTVDVIGLAVDGDRAAVQLFPLRDGRLIDRYAFHLENVEGQDRATILEGVLPRVLHRRAERAAAADRPGRPDRHRGARRLPLRAARRRGRGAGAGARREAAAGRARGRERAARARRTRRPRPSRSGCAGSRRSRACASALNLESLPVRIECFDISNLQGRDIVAVDDGVRRRAAEEGALPLVHGARPRRPGRLRVDGPGHRAPFRPPARRADADRYDESFAAVPNLVVIDGGKGQLAAALEAIQATADLPRVAVIALAKREEEVFVPGRSKPILLDRHDPGLQLLQRIRDEAHRFAITLPPPEARHAGVRVDLRHARGHRARRGGARSCSTSARPTASSRRRRRSSRRCRGCRRRPRARSTASCTGTGGPASSAELGRSLVRRVRRPGRAQAAEAQRPQREQDGGEPDERR